MSKIEALISKDFKRYEIKNSHLKSDHVCLVTGAGAQLAVKFLNSF